MKGKETLLQKGYALEQKGGIDKYEKVVKDVYIGEGIIVTHHLESKTITVESYHDDHFNSRYSGMRTVPLDKELLELLKDLLADEKE